MYSELYEYLILYKKISIPGIGTFKVDRTPAVADFTHKLIHPPAFNISFDSYGEAPVKVFFEWLSERLRVSYSDAIVRFNGFAISLKDQLMSGDKINWKQVGILSKGMSGEIKFEPQGQVVAGPPVNAIRVIRDKAEHSVRVGEQEKTSTEMTEWLNQSNRRNIPWWAPALIAAILTAILLGLYFSQTGFNTSSGANQRSLRTSEPASTHQRIQ